METQSSLMILLVGGQPLPNLLPVRHYRPDAVLFLYTTTTRQVFERLKVTIGRNTTVYDRQVEPYDVIAITQAIQDCLQEPAFRNRELIFNVTGGTKAMALAAYQVAQQWQAPLLYLESEGKQSRIYGYSWQKKKLQRTPNELLPACVSLDDFFDVHLGPENWHEHGASRDEGGPFETALANALRPHVDEVKVGVKTLGGQVDLDLAVRAGNQFGIVEAKVGNKGSRLDGLKQLSNAGRHLGTYTQQFYAITVAPNEAHQAIVEASRIRVISLPDYLPGFEFLPPQEGEKLVNSVVKALKG